jgi:DNA polymerase III epsilon subunit-like protein
MAQSISQIYPVKLTLIDEQGLILLDTLVNPCAPITQSCEQIHGISMSWLSDAPTVNEVKAHILQICSGSNFVGHSVRHDLKALGIAVPYVDTTYFEDMEERRKDTPSLKGLAEKYLNVRIQTNIHSSVSFSFI